MSCVKARFITGDEVTLRNCLTVRDVKVDTKKATNPKKNWNKTLKNPFWSGVLKKKRLFFVKKILFWQRSPPQKKHIFYNRHGYFCEAKMNFYLRSTIYITPPLVNTRENRENMGTTWKILFSRATHWLWCDRCK